MSDDEITAGMLRWEPGSLSSTVLERVLMDALADLWQDSYRQGDGTRERAGRFRDTLTRAARCATGFDVI